MKCYQCAYSPGKTVYEEETYPEDIVTYDEYHNKVTKTIYKVKHINLLHTDPSLHKKTSTSNNITLANVDQNWLKLIYLVLTLDNWEC